MIVLLVASALFGTLSLRTYVIIPAKKRKESKLLEKTQKYKDVMNIDTILISSQQSGIPIFSKSYSILQKYQNELLTGFIQAITLISNEIIGRERIEKVMIKSDKIKGYEKIIELDFKHFNFFISDYKDIRVIFIIKDKASERFKTKTAEFLSDLQLRVAKKITKWDGDLGIFQKVIPPLLEKHFYIHYREKFKLNPVIDSNQLVKEQGLNKITERLLNVIISIASQNEEFYLDEAVNTLHARNKDKVIEALELLLETEIVIPINGTFSFGI